MGHRLSTRCSTTPGAHCRALADVPQLLASRSLSHSPATLPTSTPPPLASPLCCSMKAAESGLQWSPRLLELAARRMARSETVSSPPLPPPCIPTSQDAVGGRGGRMRHARNRENMFLG